MLFLSWLAQGTTIFFVVFIFIFSLEKAKKAEDKSLAMTIWFSALGVVLTLELIAFVLLGILGKIPIK